MSQTFIVSIDGQILRKKSQKQLRAALLHHDAEGWHFESCHETWEAAEKAERKYIAEHEYPYIALVGFRPE